MGTPVADPHGYDDERPVHRVVVPPFRLAVTPVTNVQYARFLEAKPDVAEPRHWAARDFNAADQPVVGVSWHDARAFCTWAGLRLPSEAEWEYACRAGTVTRFSSGDHDADLSSVGWHDANSGGRTHAVGSKSPNPWGLYDMHGNVFEWCVDTWHRSYAAAPIDGSGWVEATTEFRVVRGGFFSGAARVARSAHRFYVGADSRRYDTGFRPAKSCRPGETIAHRLSGTK